MNVVRWNLLALLGVVIAVTQFWAAKPIVERFLSGDVPRRRRRDLSFALANSWYLAEVAGFWLSLVRPTGPMAFVFAAVLFAAQCVLAMAVVARSLRDSRPSRERIDGLAVILASSWCVAEVVGALLVRVH